MSDFHVTVRDGKRVAFKTEPQATLLMLRKFWDSQKVDGGFGDE
jgi:hypothetical protein